MEFFFLIVGWIQTKEGKILLSSLFRSVGRAKKLKKELYCVDLTKRLGP
jgi:hypothetical protein